MTEIIPISKPINAGRSWSDAEDAALLDYDAQAWPIEAIAAALRRWPAEIGERLKAQRRP